MDGLAYPHSILARIAADMDGTRDRWLAGLCPCCGGAVTEHYDGTEPQEIGEGVMICGRCVANQHMRGGFDQLILRSLLPDRGRTGA